jgi:2-oxoacid:acceptor oxidoreductase delta subunit (pyruvate/2-ketoisovalerate family)
MPAVASEIEEALTEGVRIEFLTSPVGITRSAGTLHVACGRNRLGEVGSDGRRTSVPIAGSTIFIETDTVITAIGEDVESGGLLHPLERSGTGVIVDGWGATSIPGVFADGDVTGGPRTVSHAIGSGKKAALAIDSFIRGWKKDRAKSLFLGGKGGLSMAQWADPSQETTQSNQVVTFEDLNCAYFAHKTREPMPQIADSARRMRSFDEVNLGFSEESAVREAERCFQCGTCSLCENCYIFCPDSAVSREDQAKAFKIDYEFCKGCGICVSECPVHYIEMVREEK